MKLLKIDLETANLQKMKHFYNHILEMPIIRENESFFIVKAGQTLLTFQQTENVPFYHFAMRTNTAFFDYMFKKLSENGIELLPDEEGQTSLYWHGKQVYFKDPDGNILEILERDQIVKTEKNGWFDICEIGLPSPNVEQLSNFLAPNIPTDNYAYNKAFRFYGNDNGVFVLVKADRHWYPTNNGATIHPITVEVEGEFDRVLQHPTLPYTVKVKNKWSNELPVVQMRVARPTDQLAEIIKFYEVGLGLTRIAQFNDHDGFDGVMYGLPNTHYHLEFTSHRDGSPCPAPTKDNLLVFYIPNDGAITRIVDRLGKLGYHEVEPENPYWAKGGVTIEDPDGWRIVLFLSTGI